MLPLHALERDALVDPCLCSQAEVAQVKQHRTAHCTHVARWVAVLHAENDEDVEVGRGLPRPAAPPPFHAKTADAVGGRDRKGNTRS